MPGPHPHRVPGKPYSPHPHPGHHPYTGSSHRGMKRPREESPKFPSASSRHSMSSKHGPPHSSTKPVKPSKPVTKTAKTTKTANTKATDTSPRPTILKKKKKVVSQSSKGVQVADRLVYLTGIPKDATEQEVTDLVGAFGKINNVILMPCSEEETKSGEGQKASVCMVKAEDAHSLAASTSLSIRDQQITAVISQKPSVKNPPAANTRVPSPALEKAAAVENSSKETTTIKEEPKVQAEQKASTEKALVLVTGLPESDWSESDIVSLVEPFGIPSEVITAKQIRKALVLMPDIDVAQEMVKLNTVTPMELKGCELSMTQLSQPVSLSTPVALYNLLMGSAEPSESSAPVGWSSLLVINNIPGTPSGPSEVEKLVRRFGTVIKTLVVNSMLICQMATAAMALSVYKRFQTFPCIIHNNPLYFSRKPDPKTSTQSKVAVTNSESREETSAAKDKGVQPAPSADKTGSDHPPEEMKKADEGKDEPVKSAEESAGAVEASGENGSKDDDIKKDEPVTDPSAAPDAQPEAELEMKTTETSTLETGTVKEAVEEEKSVGEPKAENDKTSTDEESKPSTSECNEVSPEEQKEELPKLTQEMVNTLLVECRTRTNSGAASTNGDKEETPTEADHGNKAAEKTKVTAKNQAEQEAKKQERERKEREARKEKEARERKERERKAWEKERAKREKEREERTRRERERREQERKEWERKDRARRERKRSHGEDGSRASGRSEAKSSRRDESHSETENEMEMNCDEFPFNLSDFVTVDEVGDVADLPCDPCSPQTMEHATTPIQVDASEDTPMKVSTEATTSETPSTLVQSEPTAESEAVTVPAAEKSDGLLASDLTAASQTSSSDSSHSQTHVPVCEPEVQEASETESAAAQAEPITTPAPAGLSAPADSSEQAEEKQQEEEQNEEEGENQLEEAKQREEEQRLQEERQREEEHRLEEEKKREEEKRLEEEKKREKEKQLEEERKKEEEKRLKEERRKQLEEERQEEEAKRLEEEKQKEQKRLEEEKQKEEKKQQEVKEQDSSAPAEDTENLQKCKDQTNEKKEESVKEKTPVNTGNSLPPYNPSNPVGMEFLVPKTGFFCKPCNRFFTGVKEAEISHCKTLKHYDNLQKYLQTTKTVSS